MVNVSEISMRGEQRGIGIYFITERSRIALTVGSIELKVSGFLIPILRFLMNQISRINHICLFIYLLLFIIYYS